MRSQFVSSLFEVCALHTKPLVRQPTHVSPIAADAYCNTLQVTTSPDSAVVHEIVVTSSSTGYELGVLYSLYADSPAEQRLHWDDKFGRFVAQNQSGGTKKLPMQKAYTDSGYLI